MVSQQPYDCYSCRVAQSLSKTGYYNVLFLKMFCFTVCHSSCVLKINRKYTMNIRFYKNISQFFYLYFQIIIVR